MKFKYILRGNGACCLTKAKGERLDYCSLQMPSEEQLTEVRFSEFNPMLHSFCLNEVPVREIAFIRGMALKGPLVAAADGKERYQLAHEHGSGIRMRLYFFLIRRKKESVCAP